MSSIHEGDTVRLKAAYRYGKAAGETIPAGTEGWVVDVHGQGHGLAVEFTLRAPSFGRSGEVLDYGRFELGFLGADQVLPV